MHKGMFLEEIFSYIDGCLCKIKQILEYHPQMLQEYLRGADQTSFMYPRFVVTQLHATLICLSRL